MKRPSWRIPAGRLESATCAPSNVRENVGGAADAARRHTSAKATPNETAKNCTSVGRTAGLRGPTRVGVSHTAAGETRAARPAPMRPPSLSLMSLIRSSFLVNEGPSPESHEHGLATRLNPIGAGVEIRLRRVVRSPRRRGEHARQARAGSRPRAPQAAGRRRGADAASGIRGGAPGSSLVEERRSGLDASGRDGGGRLDRRRQSPHRGPSRGGGIRSSRCSA